jgi:hypothetical protein
VMRMIAEHRLEYATPTELARVIAMNRPVSDGGSDSPRG